MAGKTLRLTEQQLADIKRLKYEFGWVNPRTGADTRRTASSKRSHPEDAEQMALFQWVALHINRVPELGLLIHIPNGGARNPREAARFKKMGVKAGVSDLLLPVSKEQYDKDGFNHFQCGGLWIEMKAKGRYLTGPQRKWQDAMTIEGYRCRVCYSWQEAAREIADYLGREEIKP
jgi:hypothetical protein